jgi:hypothetical protein
MFEIKYPTGFVINAGFAESAAQQLGGTANKIGNGYNWYSLPLLKDDDFTMGISVCFFHGKLAHVSLAAVDDEFGTSWDDWTEEKEHKRVKKTKQWLNRNDLRIGVYAWGTVDCGYDVKADLGSANIWLFCNQNSFLGMVLSLPEYGAIRQILINLLSNWDKKIAKNWGFREQECRRACAIFPHAEDVQLSAKVVLTTLQHTIETKTTKQLRARNIRLNKTQLKTLFKKLSTHLQMTA